MNFIKILGIVLFNALLIYAVYSRFENMYKVYKKKIYAFDILLVNKEVFKKGEYKFNEEITITIKAE